MTVEATGAAAALLAQVRDGWRPFRGALARVGLTALGDPTPVGWSLRDLVVHCSAWHDLAAQRIDDFRASGNPAPFDLEVDAFNARVAEAARSRSSHDLMLELEASFGRIRAAVERLDDAQATSHVTEGRSWAQAVVGGNTFGHYAEHQPEVDAAVPRTAADLVRAIERAWRPFREAVRDRGRAGLADATGTGWAYRDVVAHTSGWLQQAVRELRDRDFATWDRAGIDAHNARSVEARRLVGPEALVDELDTSYRALVRAVSGLSEADLTDPRVFGAAAFYGHLHWEEHVAEMGAHV